MYGWIWRTLPGGRAAKAAQALVLLAAVVVLLFLFVFPWAERRLPFGDVTVTDGSTEGRRAPVEAPLR